MYWHSVVVSGVRRMNEVNACWVWLVLGWVTVSRWVYHLGMQQANYRSTQPCIPRGRLVEYQLCLG